MYDMEIIENESVYLLYHLAIEQLYFAPLAIQSHSNLDG